MLPIYQGLYVTHISIFVCYTYITVCILPIYQGLYVTLQYNAMTTHGNQNKCQPKTNVNQKQMSTKNKSQPKTTQPNPT